MATVAEIRRTVRAIIADLDMALAFYETYVPTGQDTDLIDRVNAVDFYPAFNIISNALHMNVILSLCRTWDTSPKTDNLVGLGRKFRRSVVEITKAGFKVDHQVLDQWLVNVEAENKSSELLALRRLRNRVIAHRANPNIPYTEKARHAVYGDERKVLDTTIPIVAEAGSFVGIIDRLPFIEQRNTRQEHSRKFWDQIAPAQVG